jgi:hypothetical protein
LAESDSKARLKEFSPAAPVRRKLARTDYPELAVTEEQYKKLCEIGVHPVPGLTPGHYTGTGRPMLGGGLMQPVGVYMCTTELGYAVGISAIPLIALLNPTEDVKQLLFDASVRLLRSLGKFNIMNYDELLNGLLERPPIERMARVDRKAVITNVRAKAPSVDRPLPVVAVAAQRAERTEAEGVPVALMRWVMIRDRRRRETASFLAQDAQRLD